MPDGRELRVGVEALPIIRAHTIVSSMPTIRSRRVYSCLGSYTARRPARRGLMRRSSFQLGEEWQILADELVTRHRDGASAASRARRRFGIVHEYECSTLTLRADGGEIGGLGQHDEIPPKRADDLAPARAIQQVRRTTDVSCVSRRCRLQGDSRTAGALVHAASDWRRARASNFQAVRPSRTSRYASAG
jgi:hypothetical protein